MTQNTQAKTQATQPSLDELRNNIRLHTHADENQCVQTLIEQCKPQRHSTKQHQPTRLHPSLPSAEQTPHNAACSMPSYKNLAYQTKKALHLCAWQKPYSEFLTPQPPTN